MGGLLRTVLALSAAPGTALAQPASPFTPPAAGQAEPSPPPGTLREAARPPPPGSLYIRQKPGNALLVTEYLGRAVVGRDNQKVGAINNLLVDTTGRVVGVVIEVGAFLGFGSKEVAIAFEALFPVLEDGKEAFIVELTREQLAAAPPFKRAP